jgi:hypothetical protein
MIAALPTVFLAIAVLIVCGRSKDWVAAALALIALLALLAPALLHR